MTGFLLAVSVGAWTYHLVRNPGRFQQRLEDICRHSWKHTKSLWHIHRIGMPRWEDDKIAAMLGISKFGCPVCGFGSVRDRKQKLGDW